MKTIHSLTGVRAPEHGLFRETLHIFKSDLFYKFGINESKAVRPEFKKRRKGAKNKSHTNESARNKKNNDKGLRKIGRYCKGYKAVRFNWFKRVPVLSPKIKFQFISTRHGR